MTQGLAAQVKVAFRIWGMLSNTPFKFGLEGLGLGAFLLTRLSLRGFSSWQSRPRHLGLGRLGFVFCFYAPFQVGDAGFRL